MGEILDNAIQGLALKAKEGKIKSHILAAAKFCVWHALDDLLKRNEIDVEEQFYGTPDPLIDIVCDYEDKELYANVRRLIDTELNGRDREIFIRFYWKRHLLKDIAIDLGIKENAISTYHKRALDRLGKAIKTGNLLSI